MQYCNSHDAPNYFAKCSVRKLSRPETKTPIFENPSILPEFHPKSGIRDRSSLEIARAGTQQDLLSIEIL
jgi:hypothetical protein